MKILNTDPRGRMETLSFPSLSKIPFFVLGHHRSSHEIAYEEKKDSHTSNLTRPLCQRKYNNSALLPSRRRNVIQFESQIWSSYAISISFSFAPMVPTRPNFFVGLIAREARCTETLQARETKYHIASNWIFFDELTYSHTWMIALFFRYIFINLQHQRCDWKYDASESDFTCTFGSG